MKGRPAGSATTYWDHVSVTPSSVNNSGGTSFQPTYDLSTNRFATLASGTPSYDGNGNLLSDGFHTYTWNADGKNISIDNDAAIMAYDALGRWVERATSSGHTQAVYAPDGSLLAVANGQALVHGYLAMPGGAMAHYTASGLAEYWHPDWLGTPRLASTPTRTVSNDMAYEPYGEQYVGSAATTTTFFTGAAQALESTDLLTFPARNYQTAQGRWISPDPAGMSAVDLTNPPTLNRYAYVNSNPLALVDPTGMDANYSGIQNGSCPASQASCPLNGSPVVGTPTVPDEMTAGEQNYINAVVRPGFLGIPPVFVYGGLPTGSTGATIYFGSVTNWLSTDMIHVSGFMAASADPDPSTYEVPADIDIWKGQQQLWHNTAVVGNATAVATGVLMVAPVVAEAAGSAEVAGGLTAIRKVGLIAAARIGQLPTYLFAQGDNRTTAKGILNANDYLRIGMGFNGSIGREVFRLSLGSKRVPLPAWIPGLVNGTFHIDLWTF